MFLNKKLFAVTNRHNQTSQEGFDPSDIRLKISNPIPLSFPPPTVSTRVPRNVLQPPR